MSTSNNSPKSPSHQTSSSPFDAKQLSVAFDIIAKTTDENAPGQSTHFIDLDANQDIDIQNGSLDVVPVQIRHIPFTALTMDEIRRRRQGHNRAITPNQFKLEYNIVAAQLADTLDLTTPSQLPILPSSMISPHSTFSTSTSALNTSNITQTHQNIQPSNIPPPPPLPIDDLLVDSPFKVIQHAIDREIAQYGLLTQPQQVHPDRLRSQSLPPDLSNLPRFGASIPNVAELEAPLEHIKNERFHTLLSKPLPTGQNSIKYADIASLQASIDQKDQIPLDADQVLLKICVFDPFTQMLMVEAVFTDDMPLTSLRDAIGTQCPYDQVDMYNPHKMIPRRVEFERPQDIFFHNIQTRYIIASIYHQLEQYKYSIETLYLDRDWQNDENKQDTLRPTTVATMSENDQFSTSQHNETTPTTKKVQYMDLLFKYRNLLEELRISQDILQGQESDIQAMQEYDVLRRKSFGKRRSQFSTSKQGHPAYSKNRQGDKDTNDENGQDINGSDNGDGTGDELEQNLLEDIRDELEYGFQLSTTKKGAKNDAKKGAKKGTKSAKGATKNEKLKETTTRRQKEQYNVDTDDNIEDNDNNDDNDNDGILPPRKSTKLAQKSFKMKLLADKDAKFNEFIAQNATKNPTPRQVNKRFFALSRNSRESTQIALEYNLIKRSQMRNVFERYLQRISKSVNSTTGLGCTPNHIHEHTIFQPHAFTQYEIDFSTFQVQNDELSAQKTELTDRLAAYRTSLASTQSYSLTPSHTTSHSSNPIQVEDILLSSLYLQDQLCTSMKKKLGLADLIPSNLKGYTTANAYHTEYREWVRKWYPRLHALQQKLHVHRGEWKKRIITSLLLVLAKCAMLTRPVHFPQEIYHWIPETVLLPHPSSFFYIDGTFYDDRRSPLSVSLSDSIIQHGISPHLTYDPHIISPPQPLAPQPNDHSDPNGQNQTPSFFKSSPQHTISQQRHLHNGLGVFKQFKQETTTFGDIPFRIGQQYLFQHQGHCQHIIMCTEMRIKSTEDYNNKKMYPLVIFRSNQQYLQRSTHINIFTKHGISAPSVHQSNSPFSINFVPVGTNARTNNQAQNQFLDQFHETGSKIAASAATRSELIAPQDIHRNPNAKLSVQATTLYNNGTFHFETSYAVNNSVVMHPSNLKPIFSPYNPHITPINSHALGIEQVSQCLSCDRIAAMLVYAHPLCPRNPTPLCDSCFHSLSFEPFHENTPELHLDIQHHQHHQQLDTHSVTQAVAQSTSAHPPLCFTQLCPTLSSVSSSSSSFSSSPLPTLLHVPFDLSNALKTTLAVQLHPAPQTITPALTVKPLFPLRNLHKKPIEINKVRIQRREKRIDTIKGVLSPAEILIQQQHHNNNVKKRTDAVHIFMSKPTPYDSTDQNYKDDLNGMLFDEFGQLMMENTGTDLMAPLYSRLLTQNITQPRTQKGMENQIKFFETIQHEVTLDPMTGLLGQSRVVTPMDDVAYGIDLTNDSNSFSFHEVGINLVNNQ